MLEGEGIPYHVTYPYVHHLCEQTDTCKHITFPQLLWQPVKINMYISEDKVYSKEGKRC